MTNVATADAYCLLCGRAIVWFNDLGWLHTDTKRDAEHTARPDR